MKIRRLLTAPVRMMLRATGYDVVRIGSPGASPPAPLAPVAPAYAPPATGPLAANPILRRIYEEGLVDNAEGKPIGDARMSAIQVADGMLLYNLLTKARPEKTLEVGMAYAASTLFICEGHKQNGSGTHVAMDPFQSQSYNNIGLLNVSRSGFDSMFTFYPEESYRVLPRLLEEKRFFDFIFIDGDHLFDSVLLDFCYADRLLKPGGLVMFHDLDMPSVRKAVSFILRSKPYMVAQEYHGQAAPHFEERFSRFIRNVVKNPLEPLIWPYYSIRMPFLSVVLKKIDDDHRLWTHYASF